MKRVLIIALPAAMWLAACTTQLRKEPPVEPWETRRAQLQQREKFNLKARLAVAAKQEGFNARLRWQQEGARSQVALDGPLGVGGAQIELDGQTLTVRTASGQQLNDEAARSELLTRLGFEPPLQSLRYWIQGVPDPASPADEALDEQHRLASLRQAGWEIDYGSYSSAAGQWLPERMALRRDDVRVRLLIDGWSP